MEITVSIKKKQKKANPSRGEQNRRSAGSLTTGGEGRVWRSVIKHCLDRRRPGPAVLFGINAVKKPLQGLGPGRLDIVDGR